MGPEEIEAGEERRRWEGRVSESPGGVAWMEEWRRRRAELAGVMGWPGLCSVRFARIEAPLQHSSFAGFFLEERERGNFVNVSVKFLCL